MVIFGMKGIYDYSAKCITSLLFEDVNECGVNDKCHNSAQCTNTIGGYNCTCNSGYRGDGFNCTGTQLFPTNMHSIYQ